MKALHLIALFLNLICSAIALDASDLPSCSLLCFTGAIGASGCNMGDTVCQCTTGKETITKVATPCIIAKCEQADILKAGQMSTQICDAALKKANETAAKKAADKNGAAAGSMVPAGVLALLAVAATMLAL